MSTPTDDDVRRAVLRDGIKGRDDEIARLKGEVAEVRDGVLHVVLDPELYARAERAEADAATLRELGGRVFDFAQHHTGCAERMTEVCDCGLAALARQWNAALTSGDQG